ncbi:MAG: NADAR family protein [Patescibacteria group bacterium]
MAQAVALQDAVLYDNDMEVPLVIFERYFCPYSAHAVEVGGILYPTIEHAYHCQRYSDPNIREAIRAARSPLLAWTISQQHKARQLPHFAEYKVGVMHLLCWYKAKQHEDVRKTLIETGHLFIVKHRTTGTPADGFWDDGLDGSGHNMGGRIWQRVRTTLQQQTPRQ